MIRHLTAADFRRMPWANGRGTTTELLREDGAGGLALRLSVATVAEDGPFSLFPGVDRVLTVVTGAGFTLDDGAVRRAATPLVPVAFPGDVPIRAVGVTAPSEDFNVMTARGLPRPEVWRVDEDVVPAGGRVFLFAVSPASAGGIALARHDLLAVTDAEVRVAGGPLLAVRLA